MGATAQMSINRIPGNKILVVVTEWNIRYIQDASILVTSNNMDEF